MGYKFWGIKSHDTSARQKPTRTKLNGMSCSEFKTRLKMLGFDVPRDFFKQGSIARRGSRRYRFRWWSDEFMCDISESDLTFDRWANSTEQQVPIQFIFDGYIIKSTV